MLFRRVVFSITIVVLALSAIVLPRAATAAKTTLASWTVFDSTDPTYRNEYDIAISDGVLTFTDVNSSKIVGIRGRTDTYVIRLSRIRYFEAHTYQDNDGTKTYEIFAYAKGDNDLVHTTIDKDETDVDRPNNSIFGIFDADQRPLRDDTFRKLCALIHQAPVIKD